VNLLLVEPAEIADGVCTLDGRRAEHLRTVLRVTVGSTVRAGMIGGGIGMATVIADEGASIRVRLEIEGPPPPQLDVELILAIPRPKMLSRVIEACAAFGVRRIDLTNAWRVDKSYLGSDRLEPRALAASALLGAEQGATTHLPEIHVHDRLMALLDERYPALRGPLAMRLLAHPTAPPIENVVTVRGPTVLAIGAEGGWIQRELDTFVARGFVPVSLGAPILRVETAVSAALGQLVLLHRLRP
jgi:16S rRNA (uracil1498-N3)-methyltransferase